MARNELHDITYIESIIFNVLDEVSELVQSHEKSHNFNYITLGLIDDFCSNSVVPFFKEHRHSHDILERITRLEKTLSHLFLEEKKANHTKQLTINATLRNLNKIMTVLRKKVSDLTYYSVHDPLTYLYNRRYFNEALTSEIERASRKGHEFSLLYIDLDDFKQINDTYGHSMGDRVLVALSEIFEKDSRQYDVVSRLSGDEFAIILPETDLICSKIIAEKIHYKVSLLEFYDKKGHSFHLSISMGLALFPLEGKDARSLSHKADVALYFAKTAGKNKTAWNHTLVYG